MFEENEDTKEEETTLEETAGEDDGTPGSTGMENPLSKATDRAERPGFRSKANTGSKAMKKKRKKR